MRNLLFGSSLYKKWVGRAHLLVMDRARRDICTTHSAKYVRFIAIDGLLTALAENNNLITVI